MGKLIIIPIESIKRYYPNKEIFINIISFLSNNFSNHAMIAGGAARYMLSPDEHDNIAPADDIDIYLLNCAMGYEESSIREDFIKFVFGNKLVKKRYKWIDNLKFKGQDDLQYEITTLVCRPYFPNIQFISVFSNDINNDINYVATRPNDEDILNSFDFTICQAAIFPWFERLVCEVSDEFMEDEKNRVLRITGKIHDNLISRIYKYIKLGYTLSEESYIHILNHLSTTGDSTERRLGHSLLRKKRENGDFIIAPIANELYEKWLKSISL